jgi:hypothetical protein
MNKFSRRIPLHFRLIISITLGTKLTMLQSFLRGGASQLILLGIDCQDDADKAKVNS